MNILFDKTYYLTVELNITGEITPHVPIVPLNTPMLIFISNRFLITIMCQFRITFYSCLY